MKNDLLNALKDRLKDITKRKIQGETKPWYFMQLKKMTPHYEMSFLIFKSFKVV